MASLEGRGLRVYIRDWRRGGVPERCREWPGFAGVNGPLMAHRALRRRLVGRSVGGDDGAAAHTRPISRGDVVGPVRVISASRIWRGSPDPEMSVLVRWPLLAATNPRSCGSTTTQGADPLVARTVMHGLKSAMFSSAARSSATTMSVAGVLLDRRRFWCRQPRRNQTPPTRSPCIT